MESILLDFSITTDKWSSTEHFNTLQNNNLRYVEIPLGWDELPRKCEFP